MGISVGLDFGTTYTTLSLVEKEGGRNVAQALNFGSRRYPVYDVPTILAVNKNDKNDVEIGKKAIAKILSEDYHIFRGFKMLLNEKDEKVLSQRGFSKTFTPEDATQLFLTKLFTEAKEILVEQRLSAVIDRVVVGVPFVWTSKNNNDFSGNDKKKQIVSNVVKIASAAKDVEFRAEPELAGGFFADMIKNTKAENAYNGHLLVIDYGGGTLDVTLCKVNDGEDGASRIEPIGDGWGAGENHDANGQIGNAGLRFMEKVADITLAENGISEAEIHNNHFTEGNDITDERKLYVAFVNEIEEKIIDSDDVKKNIVKTKYNDPNGDGYNKPIDGVHGSYNGHIYHVRYGTLVKAYEVCKDELENVLLSVKEWIDEANAEYEKQNKEDQKISYDDFSNGTFKVVTVGGFCNFKLTIDQIENKIEWLKKVGQNDTRYEALDETEQAAAVSFGAALLSNNLVLIPHKFPYSLYVYAEKSKKAEYEELGGLKGVKSETVPNMEKAFCFFEENETYTPGTPVFLRIKGTNVKKSVIGRKIPFIQRKRGKDCTDVVRPSIDLNLPNQHDRIYLAIAMEKDEKLTLYIYNEAKYDDKTMTDEERDNPRNKALIGEPIQYPDIYTLLGNLY